MIHIGMEKRFRMTERERETKTVMDGLLALHGHMYTNLENSSAPLISCMITSQSVYKQKWRNPKTTHMQSDS